MLRIGFINMRRRHLTFHLSVFSFQFNFCSEGVRRCAPYQKKLEGVAYRKIQCSIPPIKTLYPSFTLWSIRIMKLHTEVETENYI